MVEIRRVAASMPANMAVIRFIEVLEEVAFELLHRR